VLNDYYPLHFDTSFSERNEVILDLMLKSEREILIAGAKINNFKFRVEEKKLISLLGLLLYLSIEKDIKIYILSTPNFEKTKLAIKLKSSPNIELRSCARNHLKVLIIDRKYAYFGSANFTGGGMGARGKNKINFEVCMYTNNRNIIDKLYRLIIDIWNGRYCHSCVYRKRDNIKCSIK